MPFKKVFRARLDIVMTSHIKFPKVDADWPVTLSEKFLQGVLRGELRYRGLVISDDLDMKALANNFSAEQIPVRALQAGCDILLYCNNFDKPPIAIAAINKAVKEHSLSAQRLEESYSKVVALKKELLAEPDPQNIADSLKMIGRAEHLQLAAAIDSGSVPADLLAAA